MDQIDWAFTLGLFVMVFVCVIAGAGIGSEINDYLRERRRRGK